MIPLRSFPVLAVVLAALIFAAYLQSVSLNDGGLYALPSVAASGR